MLDPRRQLLPPPPVFGRPWFWQRSGSSVEISRGLAQVVMEIKDQISKLEAENQDLRGDEGQWTLSGTAGPCGLDSSSPAAGGRWSPEENVPVNLRRNVSAPLLKGQYKENIVMTVRRYSVSSQLTDGHRGRIDDSGWRKVQEEIRARGGVAKVSNRHSLQEFVHKNRTKVKTVSFLLPVDDIYTNRPVLPKHREAPAIPDMYAITETDS